MASKQKAQNETIALTSDCEANALRLFLQNCSSSQLYIEQKRSGYYIRKIIKLETFENIIIISSE